MKAIAVVLPILAASVFAVAANAHNPGYYWSEDYAIKKARTIHAHYQGEAEEARAQLAEAQDRYTLVKQQSDACNCTGYLNEVTRAAISLAAARSFYEGATKGWPVVRANCDGRGKPNRSYRFKHFRCGVLIDHDGTLEVGDVYIHALSVLRFSYQWID